MSSFRVQSILHSVLLAALFCFASASRADVIVYTGADPKLFVRHPLERYSDAGVDLGLFAAPSAETLDNFYGAPNGDVYTFGNNLGGMAIVRFSHSGQVVGQNQSPQPYETAAIVVRGRTVLLASASPNPGANYEYLAGGIYSANAQTLTVTRRLLTTPVLSTLGYLSFALSPGDDVLYAWTILNNGSGEIRAMSISDNAINPVPLFTIADHGQLAVSPAGSRLLVGNSNGLSWYSTNADDSAIAHPLIPLGTQGFTTFDDYAFTPDGNLMVTAKTSAGVGLYLFDGDTGAFICHLTDFSGANFADIAYSVPECSFAAILPLLSLLLLVIRPRPAMC